MKNRFKIIAAVLAAILTLSAAGCSKEEASSADESTVSSVTEESSSAAESETDSSHDESSQAEPQTVNEQGEGIKKAYDLIKSGVYTMKVKYTDPDGEITQIFRTANGDNLYQLQENRIGKSGAIKVGDVCYDFDNVCGIYRKASSEELGTIIERIVDDNLPMTASHINKEDAENYNVEEYTYTGDTYITTLDFCFDKETGDLVKYTSTYSVEGKDDISETREYEEFSAEADDSVFDLAPVEALMDFSEMAEEKRQGYCLGVFSAAGITAENMLEAGISEEDLKTISYDEFTEFVYSYGYSGI